MTKPKDPALLKRKRRGRPPLNADGTRPGDLRIRLPKELTTRLAVVCSGNRVKLPDYIRGVLDKTLPPMEPPPLPPPPPLDPEEIRRLAEENPGFPENPSDHEDPPFYYDPSTGTYSS